MGAFMSKGQADGWLRPLIGQQYPLQQAADAHVEVTEHKTTTRGKIVLNVWLKVTSTLCPDKNWPLT